MTSQQRYVGKINRIQKFSHIWRSEPDFSGPMAEQFRFQPC